MQAYFGNGTKLTVLGKKNNNYNFKSSRNTKCDNKKVSVFIVSYDCLNLFVTKILLNIVS